MVELDKRDFAVLRALDLDARAGLAEIARSARLSKSAVSQRIASLKRDGIVEGYYAIIDSSRLGYLSFRVYLKFYRAGPRKEKELLGFLFGEPCVWWLGRIHGKWDAGFVVWSRGLRDFEDFWKKFLRNFRQIIGDYSVCPYLRLRHYSSSLGQKEGAKEAGVVGGGNIADLDDSDRALLKTVSTNAGDSAVALAQKTGLTPAIVAYRLKRLEKTGVIQSFRAKINWEKLGYSLYKLEFRLDDLSKLGELRGFAESLPGLSYIDETVGGADFEPDFYLQSENELEGILEKFKEKFHASIRQVDYVVYSKELKYAYFPD